MGSEAALLPPPLRDEPLEREDSRSDGQDDEIEVEVDIEHDELDEAGNPTSSRKKRRVVKLDKKYQCPHGECGKAYSRAEHLYRHQLNHAPKQIYRCDFAGCDRNFVRADLCARHKERHTAKGSHLQRKDAFLNSQKPTTNLAEPLRSASAFNSASHETGSRLPLASTTDGPVVAASTQQYASGNDPYRPLSDLPLGTTPDATLATQASSYSTHAGNTSTTQYPVGPPPATSDDHRLGQESRPNSNYESYPQHQTAPVTSMQPPEPPTSSPMSGGPVYASHRYQYSQPMNQDYSNTTNYSNMPSLPPFGFPQGYGPMMGSGSDALTSPPSLTLSGQQAMPNSRTNSMGDLSAFDQMARVYSMPVFGNESLQRSPPMGVDENFLSMLFGTNGFDFNDLPPIEPQPVQTSPPAHKEHATPEQPEVNGSSREPPMPSITSTLDINMRESMIGEKKQQRLLQMVREYPEIQPNEDRRPKADILKGSADDSGHVMSLEMLKTYITSFWMHIHQQMPILHRPTFNCETCPDLLLLAMMCLGATCLERTHPLEVTQNSAEWAFFVAWHIRWDIFKDAEFRPTAKLWTFQALLLLELFEKMFSTRALHERAHIHHATTLTVMRRGSSLVGRSAGESEKSEDDPTRTPPGPDGTINVSGQNTPDAWWNRWITAEATRRAAFAAFVIDATHVTLFGHSAVMSPHDIRLPLPCDEALWSATSSAEVQRVEGSLAANGFKPPTFLDGLKRTLNGQKVRTNTFGRVILMAGLLSTSWHLAQRDLHVSTLGAASTLGTSSAPKWRAPLTRAFDAWRRDFDDSLAANAHWQHMLAHPDPHTAAHRDAVFESRTCLHSLAHMAMHVDLLDLQIFAAAPRALGRRVAPHDRDAVSRRMRAAWAPSARARDAAFYALRFLTEALMPEGDDAAPSVETQLAYSARDDCLLNRPWVLYFAALIVWAYGFALDGSLPASEPPLATREAQTRDMRAFLRRIGGVASPDDLDEVEGRNGCLGLLCVLEGLLRQPRWELLHEAAGHLGNARRMLMGGSGEMPEAGDAK